MSRGRYYKTSKDFHYSNYPNVLSTVNHVYPYPYTYVTKSDQELPVNHVTYVSESDQESPVDQLPVTMNMKWTTLQHVNSGHPNVWGPAFWFTLHNGAAKYPIKAAPICAERMRGFIIGMPLMIPCETCQDHATAYIEQNYHNLNEIVSCRQNLFNFFVSFHNYVNKRYNKPDMGYEEAYALYTGGVNVTKLSYSENK